MKLYMSFKNFEKNAVSGPAVAQRWPTGYILPPIANGGPLVSCYLGMMLEVGVRIHPYIDDYVVVLNRFRAEKAFGDLCSLLRELGLPINDKLTPPTDNLTCLSIRLDIDSNTMSITQEKNS